MPNHNADILTSDINTNAKDLPISFYKAVLEAIPGSVFIMDAQGRLVGWNSFTRDVIFGKPESEMRSTDSFVAIHPDDRKRIRKKFLNVVKNGGEETAETRVIYHDKTNYEWRLAHGRRIVIDGEPFVLAIGIDITEIKRIEAELKKNRLRLNQALGAARAGVWELDLKSGRSFWSDELWALFGLKRGSAKASQELWFSTIHPEDRELALSALHDARKHEREINIEYRVRHPDGSVHWLMSRGMPVRDDEGQVIRYIGTIIDITERRQTEEELKKSRAQLIFALEKSSIGWWDLDLVNRTTERTLEHDRIFGYDTLLPKWTYEMFLDHVVPEEREEIHKLHQDAIAKKSDWSFECRIRRKTGEIRWIWAATGFMQDLTGKPIDQFGIIQDITERKLEEQKREKLQSQLQQSQKMELIGQLAGGIAHDINNILTSILGHSELLLDENDTPAHFVESLQQVRASAIRAAHLIHQLLAFARKQTMMPKILGLDDAIGNLYPMLKRLIGENIDFAWRPDGMKALIRIDPSQLDQIITNLCVNARDAISGSGTVTISTAIIEVNEINCKSGHPCRMPGDYAMMSVTDNGSGIEKKILPHIFEPFFTTKEVGKGTGLGLSTVYGIVKQNNGYIECVTKPGKGTTFNVYLQRFNETADATELPFEHGESETRKQTILIIEDEPDILNLIKKVLEEHGYRVLSAPTADEAIQAVEEFKIQIDLLVTDSMFPDQNSVRLSNRLLEINPELKVLFMSGYSPEPLDQLKLFEDGIDLIQKPFGIKDFLKTVHQVISSSTTDENVEKK